MKVPRFIMVCFAANALIVSSATAAEEPATEPSLHDVISRLDKTLEHLDQIDRRVKRIENVLFRFSLRPDKHGILRDASDRYVAPEPR